MSEKLFSEIKRYLDNNISLVLLGKLLNESEFLIAKEDINVFVDEIKIKSEICNCIITPNNISGDIKGFIVGEIINEHYAFTWEINPETIIQQNLVIKDLEREIGNLEYKIDDIEYKIASLNRKIYEN